jgi:magnesium chelatase family protein
MSDVRGQTDAKWALEIAAAGGHNLLLRGSPGSGKTMLASRLPTVLPLMSTEEAIDVTRIHSVAGLLPEGLSLIRSRPFRSPHHNVSMGGLIGGGSGIGYPGESSLAHHGVLFLDELPLYRRDVLESLRGPLEEGTVRIARVGGVVRYPCRFSLIAAMNPCPCGYWDDGQRPCRCSESQRTRYLARLSGPLLDRFDMQVQMQRLTKKELLGGPEGDTSAQVRARVEGARTMQVERYGTPKITNASVGKRKLEETLALTASGRRELSELVDGLALNGRSINRVLRVARTIADLWQAETIVPDHVGEAVLLRLLEDQEEVAA